MEYLDFPELALLLQMLVALALYLNRRAHRAGLARYGTHPSTHPSTQPITSSSADSSVSVSVVNGVRVETSWSLRLGEPSTVETKVTARFEMPLDLGLGIRSGGRAPRTVRHLLDPFAADNTSVPDTFFAYADEPARVSALLGNGLGPRLVALSAHADVDVNDEGVSLSTQKAVYEPWRDWARRETVSIFLQLEANRRNLPCAEALAGLAPGYAQLASTLGLGWTHVPLAMWGQLHGVDVYARALRRGKGQYVLVISVRAPHDASGGLVVRPRARFLDLRPRRGVPVEVPDTGLVERLDIRAELPELAAVTLSEAFRSDLKELVLWGDIELSDGTIWLEIARVPDAAELAGHIDIMVRLGRRLGDGES